MPQVPKAIVKERAKRLRQEAEILHRQHLKNQINSHQLILMEKEQLGRAENFMPIKLDTPQTIGDIIPVKVIAASESYLIGTPLNK
jgi:threonylcarbamoyladenosine tRNA methylthiotransferase MtaB